VVCNRCKISQTAGFGTLRTQPAFTYRGLSGPPWRSVSKDTLTEWSTVAECIEGHITITAGFGTLRTQPAFTYRGLSGPPWRSVSKDTLQQRRDQYVYRVSNK
jgi:hypothetical protein